MKRLINIIELLAITLALMSCDKDRDHRPGFVPGEVLILFNSSASWNSVYGLIDTLELEVIFLKDFGYYLKAPEDSIDTITSILNNKPYLTDGGMTFGILYIDSTINITANFFDFDDSDNFDWVETVDHLNLTENLTGPFFKWGILSVPIGLEQYWIVQLNKFSIVSAVELNNYVNLN